MSDRNDGGQNDGGQKQAQQPDAPFYSGFEDAEVKQWVEAKGWKSPEALAKSALHLERMAGAPSDQLVRLPQDRSPESLRPVFERLGAPSDPQGYELPSGENSIPEYEKAVRETYHKLGLTKDQAKALTEFNLQFAEEYEKQANESRAASATVGEQELKREWATPFRDSFRRQIERSSSLGSPTRWSTRCRTASATGIR